MKYIKRHAEEVIQKEEKMFKARKILSELLAEKQIRDTIQKEKQ